MSRTTDATETVTATTADAFTDVRLSLNAAGQTSLVRHAQSLSAEEQEQLAVELRAAPWSEIRRWFTGYRQQLAAAQTGSAVTASASGFNDLQPPSSVVRIPKTAAEKVESAAAAAVGLQSIRSGEVGVLLVAGGQGTRLDFPHPKGMFPLLPVSGKTLYQWLAEQLLARCRAAHVEIPLYVMTSNATHDETVAFFKTHRFFGLNSQSVYFFQQGNLPAVDAETGAALLAGRTRLQLSPDGHGGVLQALDRSGLLDDMLRRGLKHLFYHQVDNPLCMVCDPTFIGHHINFAAEVSTKAVAKLDASEKVGLLAENSGRGCIVEYSDMPQQLQQELLPDGSLKYWAGNTAIHLFDVQFLQRLRTTEFDLPVHIARKRVPYIDSDGTLVNPETENGLKFERFIFDVIPQARRSLVVEADRATEFHPLKNKSGSFSADDVRQRLVAVHRQWLIAAGASVHESARVEISPLWALSAEDVRDRLSPGMVFQGDSVLE